MKSRQSRCTKQKESSHVERARLRHAWMRDIAIFIRRGPLPAPRALLPPRPSSPAPANPGPAASPPPAAAHSRARGAAAGTRSRRGERIPSGRMAWAPSPFSRSGAVAFRFPGAGGARKEGALGACGGVQLPSVLLLRAASPSRIRVAGRPRSVLGGGSAPSGPRGGGRACSEFGSQPWVSRPPPPPSAPASGSGCRRGGRCCCPPVPSGCGHLAPGCARAPRCTRTCRGRGRSRGVRASGQKGVRGLCARVCVWNVCVQGGA